MIHSLPADIKDAAKIQRRREAEEERKKRILNPRMRMFGVDVEAWKKQCEERRKQEEEDRRRELDYQKQKIKEDLIVKAHEMKIEDEKKEILEKIQEFRQVFQRYEDRREYDLNDPLYLKKALPARLCDDDPRLTISSAQRFEGEDLRRDERLKIQGEQTKAWLEQQIAEKEQEEYEKQEAERLYQQAMVARDNRATALARMEEECTRKIEESTAQFNKSLADERDMKERSKRLKDDMDKEAEKINWMNSDFLTENPDVAVSNLGPDKIICYLYKGSGLEQARKIREIQKQQIMEKQKRDGEEKHKDAEWDKLRDQLRKQVYFKDKDIVQQQRELNAQIVDMNKKLAQEKRERDEYLNKVVYTNVPSEAFYNQFNKTLY